MITLFSTDCPRCKILEKKLKDNNIEYTVSDDVQEIIEAGFLTVPVLKINDNQYLDFGPAVKWVNANAI